MLRFSAFVVAVLVSVTLQVRADEAGVVKMIKERGGTVEVDAKQPDQSVVSVSLPGGDITDADLKELKALKSLRSLSFRAIVSKSPPRANGRIADAGLKELTELKNLESLDLAGHTQITDAGLKELKGFESLHTLVLIHNKITDAGLKELAEVKNLRRLTIKFTNETVTGIVGLKDLKKLKTLSLENNNVKFGYFAEVKAALPDVEIFEESYGR
jgi:hypothetical protein